MMRAAGSALAAAYRVPPSSLAEITGGRPIVVLTPHPNDESLGCGGLIAGCAAAGIRVDVVLLTDGAGSHPGSRRYPPPRLATVRVTELADALARPGVGPAHLHRLGFADAAAPGDGMQFDAAVERISGLVRNAEARTLFATWAGDPHCDHLAASRIADAVTTRTGIRHLGGRLRPQRSYAGAATRLDIRAWLPAKRRAVACHRSQLGGLFKVSSGAFHLPRDLLQACLTTAKSSSNSAGRHDALVRCLVFRPVERGKSRSVELYRECL